MSKSKKLALPSHRTAALRVTGIREADVAKMQALCQWPEGAAKTARIAPAPTIGFHDFDMAFRTSAKRHF